MYSKCYAFIIFDTNINVIDTYCEYIKVLHSARLRKCHIKLAVPKISYKNTFFRNIPYELFLINGLLSLEKVFLYERMEINVWPQIKSSENKCSKEHQALCDLTDIWDGRADICTYVHTNILTERMDKIRIWVFCLRPLQTMNLSTIEV